MTFLATQAPGVLHLSLSESTVQDGELLQVNFPTTGRPLTAIDCRSPTKVMKGCPLIRSIDLSDCGGISALAMETFLRRRANSLLLARLRTSSCDDIVLQVAPHTAYTCLLAQDCLLTHGVDTRRWDGLERRAVWRGWSCAVAAV
jgi:hypothetical protein